MAYAQQLSSVQIVARNGVERVEPEVAWTYRTGDYPGGRVGATKTAFQATPILDGDTLFFCSPLSRAFAIDAQTGEERPTECAVRVGLHRLKKRREGIMERLRVVSSIKVVMAKNGLVALAVGKRALPGFLA